ncbi:hypothetical protein EJ04DRAFT_512010 [Polyplosphaeria fusca]|uniref:Uncharacterized protein n=1 Tax=Polyplosphaeria fusca TaxID=682080 RepID=A0A9P4R1C9_9PLEO|nr:hypothetical protein EJ04DRAFT_512010 [Polyplosphaeria fusca]
MSWAGRRFLALISMPGRASTARHAAVGTTLAPVRTKPNSQPIVDDDLAGFVDSAIPNCRAGSSQAEFRSTPSVSDYCRAAEEFDFAVDWHVACRGEPRSKHR